jgi:predicted peptidase
LESEKSTKETQFKSDQDTCLAKLTVVKGIDGSVDVSVKTEAAEDSSELTEQLKEQLKDLKYGEINYFEFESSEGRKIKYYVYVPENAKDIENLPVLLYMHGDATGDGDATRALRQGLPKMIANKEVTPQGIVIMPYFPGYDQKGSSKALKELTDTVVETYNCDKNKISVSGHSRGGMMAYQLINEYPDYFSCCVPISGSYKVTDSFKNVKVWSFNSTNEGNNLSAVTYNAGVNAVNNVNKVGGTAKLTSLKKKHKYTNEETFEKEYESPDGKTESVLDWIFRQTKA